MAARKKTRQKEAQLAFEALSIEGGLLSPDWLSKAAQLAAAQQSEADYRIEKGCNLRDEIGRFWRIAQAHWADFARGRAVGGDGRALAERFVRDLLGVPFGFASFGTVQPLTIAERVYPIGFAAVGGRVPIVIVAPRSEAEAGEKKRSALDDPKVEFGDGARRRSACGLAQEFLNAADGAMWGLASDGLTLRIVRDNASLTRPAWIEADLERIFIEERYADFAALWLLAHETRFGRVDQPVAECALEVWRNTGREEGARAREHLRSGVEDALKALGQGFLAHADNQALREVLQSGALSPKDYFNQLLRLVYRLIFLLTVEERGVLHPDDVNEKAKELYAAGYSLRRLRERSVKRSAHDRFADLWEGTKIVFRSLEGGEPRLGLPALAGIFSKAQSPALDAAKLENRALLLAVFKLSWLRETSGLSRVNWRDMGPEELGSVYESLLELVPQITKDGRQFAFATGGETKGNARKTTGSYYTPDSLVQVLLDTALEPVIKDTIAKHPANAVEALLGLSIVDPACGSGHFLLAAARRLAAHVARLSANGTPSAAEYRHALRRVVGRCIYGVDLNPMAVELCKVSLWMEAVEPGLPLTFLNSHVQYGNALLGTTPELMVKGIPDAAWDPIEGDDKKTASALKKRNKKAAAGQRSLDTLWWPRDDEAQALARAVAELEAASDENSEGIAKKESQWDGILRSTEYRHQKLVADAWCAAFVWPKLPGDLTEVAPTNELWRQLRDGQGEQATATLQTIEELAQQYRFFHWNLQFPQVFAKGGFDIVLGNPPWDRLTFEEREWFAEYSTEIAEATTAAKRRGLLAKLAEIDPSLHATFLAARRRTSGIAGFCGNSGRFPLTAVGHFNTYALFTEVAAATLTKASGRAALFAPTSVVTGDYSKALTRALLESGRLLAVFDFDNRAKFFPAMQSNVRFALVVVAGRNAPPASTTLVAAQLRRTTDINDKRVCRLAPSDVLAINPETATIPFFYSARDATVVACMYRRLPSLFDANGKSSWHVDFGRMLNMSDDSEEFRTLEELPADADRREALLPVYEAKLTGQYDHRAGTFEGVPREDRFRLHAGTNELSEETKNDPRRSILPRYWLPASSVAGDLGVKRHFLVYRDAISATADARSLAACFIPRAPSVHTLLLVRTTQVRDAVMFASAMNSFVVDYVLRQKATGAHAARFIIRQLPFLTRDKVATPVAWDQAHLVVDWILPRVLELTYTAWDLEPFARDVGYDGPPYQWAPERRFLLRCELDAAFFHLYGLPRDDTDYVMDTFPIVRKKDLKAHGEYRTKRVILEIYDAMTEATSTSKPYQTCLDPAPADPAVAHPPRFVLPPMPAALTTLPAAEDLARFVWAVVHANAGSVARTTLARAYSLRSQPLVLRGLASAEVASVAAGWSSAVATRETPASLFPLLTDLESRGAVRFDVKAGQATVERGASTPTLADVGAWHDFEARLVLQILAVLGAPQLARVDAGLSDDARNVVRMGASG